MAKIVLPKQQWAIPDGEIKPIGCDDLRLNGPSERSWQGIKRCLWNNHKPWPAFYTSSVKDSGYSDWVEFMLGLKNGSRWIYDKLYLFDLQMEEQEVYIVNEFDDYEILASEYLTKEVEYEDRMLSSYFAGRPHKTFDWVQVALDGIDCIWVKDPWCHPLLRMMDVEQCVWLHMPHFKLVGREVLDKCDE